MATAPRRRLDIVWLLKRFAQAVLAIYLLVMCLTCSLQQRMLYPRAHEEGAMSSARPEVAEGGVWLSQPIEGGGAVEALFFPAQGATVEDRRGLVVYFHGNGEWIDGAWQSAMPWRERGFHVLVPEYRGHGRSAGEPRERAMAQDVRGFITRLMAEREDIDGGRVLLHGYSLGGAVAGATLTALEEGEVPVCALILRSTFSSMGDVARDRWLPGFLARDGYETAQVVASHEALPVLVTHGERDTVVAISHGERLSRASRRVRFHRFECGHVGCPREQEYWPLVDGFLREARACGVE